MASSHIPFGESPNSFVDHGLLLATQMAIEALGHQLMSSPLTTPSVLLDRETVLQLAARESFRSQGAASLAVIALANGDSPLSTGPAFTYLARDGSYFTPAEQVNNIDS